MADFIETNNTKTALRKIETPISDIASFDAIISSVLTDNPFECTEYSSDGVTVSGVTRNKQYYTAKIVYQDDDAKSVGTVTVKSPTVEAFGASANTILADTALAGNIGGDPVRDYADDNFYCQLKCHDANGELYYVTFTRESVRVSSYTDDTILAKVETWADGVTALA